MTAIGDKDICRLDIAMNDALAVRRVEGIGDFDPDGEELIQFHRTAVDQVLERLAAEAFHHDEGMAFMLADLVNGADVGMIQRGGGAGLAAKTLEGLRVLGRIFGQKLQGNEAAELSVLGLVDDSHAPAAKQVENPVVRDCLSDHGRSEWDGANDTARAGPVILGGFGRGVNW